MRGGLGRFVAFQELDVLQRLRIEAVEFKGKFIHKILPENMLISPPRIYRHPP